LHLGFRGRNAIGARAQQLRSFYSRIFPAISPYTIGPRLLSVNICKQKPTLKRWRCDVEITDFGSSPSKARHFFPREVNIESRVRQAFLKSRWVLEHHFSDAQIPQQRRPDRLRKKSDFVRVPKG
jgi:hypothetical protein